MAYTPTNWEESTTSLGPTNLNKMEQGIKAAHDMLEPTKIASLLLDIFYPVGWYIETSDTSYNPNTALGGTWVLETEGLVHVSSGTNYPVSANAQDGGVAEVTLTAAQSGRPEATVDTESNGAHTHNYSYANRSSFTESGSSSSHYQHSGYSTKATTSAGAHTHSVTIPSADASESHTNMMPHKNVNRWHRTA